jgi:hypothetical protein
MAWLSKGWAKINPTVSHFHFLINFETDTATKNWTW